MPGRKTKTAWKAKSNDPIYIEDEFVPNDEDLNDPDYVPPPVDETEETENLGIKESRAVEKHHENQSVDEFIQEIKSPNTSRQDVFAEKVYMETMLTLTSNQNLPMVPRLIDTPKEDLAKNLERFFMCAVKKDGDLYNASTYDQLYQVFSRLLSEREDPVDLKNDIQFKKLQKVIKARKEEAVRAGKVPGMNAAKSIPQDLLAEAFRQGKFSRDNPRGLIRHINYILMTGFGQRAAQVKL